MWCIELEIKLSFKLSVTLFKNNAINSPIPAFSLFNEFFLGTFLICIVLLSFEVSMLQLEKKMSTSKLKLTYMSVFVFIITSHIYYKSE